MPAAPGIGPAAVWAARGRRTPSTPQARFDLADRGIMCGA